MSGTQSQPAVIYVSLIIGMMLSILPMPDWAQAWRPEWLAMVLAYWHMALPRRVGLFTAWIMGLLMDGLTGSLLGQHALAYVLIAYSMMLWHQRIRIFPLWQQSITVGVIIAFGMMLQLWVLGISGDDEVLTYRYWLPLITSVVFWPWVFVLLRDLRRRANLS